MKILWFTNTPSLYKKNNLGYNGGGWIESLEQIISNEIDIELGVSFFHNDACFKSKQGKTTYFPIPLYNTKFKKLKHNLFYNKYDYTEVAYFLKVINDFKPDVIHVFGSEKSFGLITQHIKIPVVIHIQGILIPCLNAYFAPGSNMKDIFIQNIFKPFNLVQIMMEMSFFKHNVKRESLILKNCKYFMGRTTWDKHITRLFAPQSIYLYCSEVLRDEFYTADPWVLKNNDKITLISTISRTSYKGFDLILKTAKLLKQYTSIKFEWNIFGIKEFKDWENKLGIKCDDVHVYPKGIAHSQTLIGNILNSNIFIHPSYIDNSPNSVCEAQILGIPVIATNIGGISSLIEDNLTGYLIPSNDPYALVARIIELVNNPELAVKIGNNAREIAIKRHNKETIKNDLLNIYNELQNGKDTN